MKTCSRCRMPHERAKSRYCAACHAAYMREWRTTHPLNPEQRRKMNSRCYANVYQRRGKLVPQPCEVCGSPDSQKHHEDYARPLEVNWLCRTCHLAHHRE